MKISRELNVALNWILNELVPPLVRDQRWFGWLLAKFLYGEKTPVYLNFHAQLYDMDEESFRHAYEDIQATALERPTDLNQKCVAAIEHAVVGRMVLEVGCGRGFLCQRLAEHHDVTAVDIVITDALKAAAGTVRFHECSAESLPFEDRSFDTVITTHTLEHVRDLQAALAELRRVCRKRLIIVVPCERPHRYTLSLHIHFFPYAFSLLHTFMPKMQYALEKLGGDWFYFEEIDSKR